MLNALKWLGIELVEVSMKEKLISAIGSALAIYSVIQVTSTILPAGAAIGVVASMGATAVLLFAVPHGPLSQPWPVFGGHVISALIGVLCAQWIANSALATALAVGVSIGLMHQFKCIHPPGGATAFTAVVGGQAIHDLELYYVFFPVASNAAVMLVLALVINYPFSWRRYPATWTNRATKQPLTTEVIMEVEHRIIVEAIRSLDSFVDVSEEDLLHLARMIANQCSRQMSLAGNDEMVQPLAKSEVWLMPSDERDSKPLETNPMC